jgi:glycosyltransferase involved in cell wall biosynthesis
LKVLVTLEDHLWRCADGCIRGHGPTGYAIWSELLDSFEQVVLLARVGDRIDSSTVGNKVEGPSVSVRELPDYLGPWNYLLTLPTLRSRVRKAVAQCDTYLIRVPGLIGRLAWQEIHRLKTPYAAEVMSDPWDSMSPGNVPGPFRPLYRETAARNLRMICENAAATLYWSRGIMRQRYPSADDAYTCVAPRIFLNGGYASPERMQERFQEIDSRSRRVWRIGFVGSFGQLYKGGDTLLRSLALCLRRGTSLDASFVGEGRYRKKMELLSHNLLVERNVNFLGQLDFGAPVSAFLDSVDLFVMPSRAEGLPRALVEAMARGCPCIGSDVGGIPELLAADDLVPPNDPEALARKIMEVTADPQRMKAMSVRNLARAKQFDPEVLRDVRRAFYQHVRDYLGNDRKSGT